MNNEINRQADSNEAYEKLIRSWSSDEWLQNIDYPAYYSGSYINDEEYLTILTTYTDHKYVIDELSKITGYDGFCISTVKFKYSELIAVMRTIDINLTSDVESTIVAVNAYAIYDKLNKIIVELDDCSPEHIALFRKHIINSACVEFRQSNGKATPCVNLNPGRRVSTSYNNGSMGYRAKQGNTVGFVTAGHVVRELGTTVRMATNSYVIGTVPSTNALKMGGAVDAAFVATTNSYTPTNVTQYGGVALQTGTGSPSVGATLFFEGASSAGSFSGVVISNNAIIYLFDPVILTYTVRDVIQLTTPIPSQPEDSGGICYAAVRYYPAGIVIARSAPDAYGNIDTYVCKANNINYEFGLTRY